MTTNIQFTSIARLNRNCSFKLLALKRTNLFEYLLFYKPTIIRIYQQLFNNDERRTMHEERHHIERIGPNHRKLP